MKLFIIGFMVGMSLFLSINTHMALESSKKLPFVQSICEEARLGNGTADWSQCNKAQKDNNINFLCSSRQEDAFCWAEVK